MFQAIFDTIDTQKHSNCFYEMQIQLGILFGWFLCCCFLKSASSESQLLWPKMAGFQPGLHIPPPIVWKGENRVNPSNELSNELRGRD